MRYLILSLLFCWSSVGQDLFWPALNLSIPQSASTSVPNYPTNDTAGYPRYVWYAGEDYSPTSGDWTDRMGLYNLSSASGKRPSGGTQNSLQTVSFDGTDDYLRSTAYTNSNGNPMEYIIAAKKRSSTTGIKCLFHGYQFDPSHRAYWDEQEFRFGTGSGLSNMGGELKTNEWFVISLPFSSTAGTYSYTNYNSQWLYQQYASSAANGITWGAYYQNTAAWAPIDIAEIIVYATNLTDTVRSYVYQYLTNKWNISLP